MYATVLILALKVVGVDLDEGTATEVVLSATALIGFFIWVYGQLKRSDLVLGLVRR